MKRVLITGVYGQDGSYLCELMHSDNYEIYGVCRRNSEGVSKRNKEELLNQSICINECYTSLHNYIEIKELINEIKPHVVFHMAAIHRASSNIINSNIYAEKQLYDLNVMATNNILTACYEVSPSTRIITAGSCLMYDDCPAEIQDESTPFVSQSMYGIAKIAEANIVRLYRKKGLFACVPILFNHESHRRSGDFVTKKIANGLKEIIEGKRERLELGDISVKKDWGFAGDYALAMKLMSENSVPKDYVVATGELHTIEEFIQQCAVELALEDWKKRVVIDSKIITRKARTNLCGNPKRCISELGWKRSYDFSDLIREILR